MHSVESYKNVNKSMRGEQINAPHSEVQLYRMSGGLRSHN